jgi:hypothetical protein
MQYSVLVFLGQVVRSHVVKQCATMAQEGDYTVKRVRSFFLVAQPVIVPLFHTAFKSQRFRLEPINEAQCPQHRRGVTYKSCVFLISIRFVAITAQNPIFL